MAHSPDATRPSPPNPLVAFLFTLRRDRHPLNRAWNTFFRSCPQTNYRVHVHSDPAFRAPSNRSQQQLATQGAFAHALVPPPYVHIARFGYTMVQARMLLLRHAASAAGQPADWFLFFSESDAPIRSCPDLLRYLSRRGGSSFAYADPPSPQQQQGGAAWARHFARACPPCAAANISAVDYRHGPGWVALHRDQVLPLLEREAVHATVFNVTGVDGLGVPDEWYWTTLVQAQGGRRYNHLLTYMQPGDAKTGHSRMFGATDLPELISKAQARQWPSFFVRKFPTNPQMDQALATSLQSMRHSGKNGSMARKIA